ncbi:unnamed protein product [Effrenium voratum]|nr:unnamed protein product [Effrenium voratum]
MVTRNKKGLCMVRKNPTSMRAAIRDSRHLSEAERKAAAAKAFFHVSKDDQVVMLESLDELNNRIEGNSGKPVVSDYRYTIEERQEERSSSLRRMRQVRFWRRTFVFWQMRWGRPSTPTASKTSRRSLCSQIRSGRIRTGPRIGWTTS